jgi:ferrous iron transport protein B
MKIGLCGNPNVGKSSIFNILTGLRQHTGNWIGKTVKNSCGRYVSDDSIEIYDLPGTYSLRSCSVEEDVARDSICFDGYDLFIVVCDALCLERNMNLLLQIMEIKKNVILCVNMIDEAEKKGVNIDVLKLSSLLEIPVFPVSAKLNIGISDMMDNVDFKGRYVDVSYGIEIDEAIDIVSSLIDDVYFINPRWIALKLICGDSSFCEVLSKKFPNLFFDKIIHEKVIEARYLLNSYGISLSSVDDVVSSSINEKCSFIFNSTVTSNSSNSYRVDRFLTSKYAGIPIMFIGLLFIFWITIVFANYPSDLLFKFFGWFESYIVSFFNFIHLNSVISSICVNGIYRVISWVISVMLPPMLIFFPLFTLLEDIGYLPRIAFTLDNSFRKCNSCGKQSLTMAMGFGCNAVGVNGTRIIDSPRERLIAILTNVFVPCNGRFPTIIMLISMFFIYSNKFSSFICALFLTLFICFSVFITFVVSFILSKTLLKGQASSFIMELPAYRKPFFLKSIMRSILDRIVIIFSKTIKFSFIAGIVIWFFANVNINGISLLRYFSNFLDGFGKIIGLDGSILVGFILGFPANEIVFPIILMDYMSSSNLVDIPSLDILKSVLVDHGFSFITALCMIVFCLFHFPCSTTCFSIYDETKSFKWTFLSIIIPLFIGIVLCFLINYFSRLFMF